MNHISVTKSPRRKKSPPRKIALETQRGRDEEGRVRTLYKLDLASDQFGAQFTRAFELSVASARKENKRVPHGKNLADPID